MSGGLNDSGPLLAAALRFSGAGMAFPGVGVAAHTAFSGGFSFGAWRGSLPAHRTAAQGNRFVSFTSWGLGFVTTGNGGGGGDGDKSHDSEEGEFGIHGGSILVCFGSAP